MIKCVPVEEAIKLKEGFKSGEISIKTLLDMSSKKKFALFNKYVDSDMAKFITIEFEKAITSTNVNALESWVKKTLPTKEQAKPLKTLNNYKNLGEFLTPTKTYDMIESVVEDKLGLSLSAEEFKTIMDMSTELDKLWESSKGLSGNIIDDFDTNLRIFKLQSDLRKYVNKMAPAPILEIFIGSTGKMVMLAATKAFSLNVLANLELKMESQLINKIEQVFTHKTFEAADNKELAKEYVRNNMKIYQATGYDMSRMDSIDDVTKILGETYTSAEGPTLRRATARFLNRVIGHYSLGWPDALFASSIFASTADLHSTMQARKEGLKGDARKARAAEIFKDAILISPTTVEGQQVRDIAKENAKYFTLTNNSTASDIAADAKKLLNKIPRTRGGDLLVPFSRTPANAVQVTLDHSGLPFFANVVFDLKKAIKLGDDKKLREIMRKGYLAGVGWVFAALLMQLLRPDDVIGDYSALSKKERELVEAKNGTFNSIGIGVGDHKIHISTDYFGPLAGTLAFLSTLKSTRDPWKASITFGQVIMKIPGLGELIDVLRGAEDIATNKKQGDDIVRDLVNGTSDWIIARVIPAILTDISYAFDPRTKQGNNPLEKIENKIPFRGSAKIDMFGNPIKGKMIPFVNLFTGARLTHGNSNDVLLELTRLNQNGDLPNIADIRYNTGRIRDLSEKLGKDTFDQLLTEFGTKFYRRSDIMIDTVKYKRSDDEGKQKMWNKLKDSIIDDIVEKYNKKWRYSDEFRNKTKKD
jgi:hypothetical protein